MTEQIQRIIADSKTIHEIPKDEITPNHLKALLYSDDVMGHPSNYERKQQRVRLLHEIPFVFEDPEFHLTIVDINPELIRFLKNPSVDVMMFTILHSPGVAKYPNLNLDLLSNEQKQELCNRHQWLADNVFPEFECAHALPQPDESLFLEVPVHTIYRSMDEQGDWDTFLNGHPLKHKNPIKRLAAKHRYHPFTKDDVLMSIDDDIVPILQSIHHSEITHSDRLVYNEGRMFDDNDYHYMIFSMPCGWFANELLGECIVNSIRNFHSRLSFMRCSYDPNTMVLGWCRYVIREDKVLIDELQTDIKKPLLQDKLVDNATLNKLEYHILVQSIKTLYDIGYREFCMPTWEQRNTLYAQAPGTHVPKDPYTYIPKRVGFTSQVVDGLHEALDNQKISYLDLRYNYVQTNTHS